MVAGVDAAGKVKLTLRGKRVTSLGPGRYKLVITDSSSKNDVTLRRIGSAGKKLTGVAFVGRRTLTAKLEPGTWKLYSSPREAASAVLFRVTR